MSASLKSLAYKALRVSNDVNAVQRGKVPQRIARRAVGRVVGRGMRRWIR